MSRATKVFVTNKVLKPGTFNAPPRVVRISVMDPYATDSSSEEYDSDSVTRHRAARGRKIINEIRIVDRSIDVLKKRLSTKQRSKQQLSVRKVTMKVEEGGARRKLRGVRQRKWGRWAAEIRDPVKRSRVWLGTFDTAEEAAIVYDREAIRLRGPNAQTNFLKPPETQDTLPRSEAFEMDLGTKVTALDGFEGSAVTSVYNSDHDIPSPTSVLIFEYDESEAKEVLAECRPMEEGWGFRDESCTQHMSFLDLSSSTDWCSDFEIPPPVFLDERCVPLFIPNDSVSDAAACSIIRGDFESFNLDLDNYFCNEKPN